MRRSPRSSFSHALLLILLGGLAGCGNKGPLFLPPPAVQQPEPAATAPAAPAPPAEQTTTEPTATETEPATPPAPPAGD